MNTSVFAPDADFARVIRNSPLVSIDLIVRSARGLVLTGLRVNEPAKGTYFVPGGVIRKNELMADAFKRIITTELGVTRDISEAQFLGVFEHLYQTNRYGDPDYGTHYVVLAYELTLLDGEAIKTDKQHSTFCWMTPSEILSHPNVHVNTKAYFG